MKYIIYIIISVACAFIFITSCSKKDEGSSTTTASEYADFGASMSNALPIGLKSGTTSSSSKTKIRSALTLQSGSCTDNYTGCPTVSESGGGDSQTGEIVMKIWAKDYGNVCSVASETCFHCPDCNSGGTWYRKPTMMINDGKDCALTNSSNLVSVNFGVDPCAFDSTIQAIEFDNCKTVEGTAYDISSIIPWYERWNIPKNVEFSAFQAQSGTSSDSGSGIYWSVINAGNTKGLYFFDISKNWIHTGIKTRDNSTGELDEFLFIGAGSPTYYEGIGETSGWNMSAFAGDLASDNNSSTRVVETYQSRSQGSNRYIQRTKINATHAWAQTWSSSDSTLPETDGEVASKKNSPSTTRCLQVGSSISAAKYVPVTDCVTAFNADNESDLNDDLNYRLKIFAEATLKTQSFSARPTTNTSNVCLSK
ncbi:MAG: hypothetical protein H8E38_07745 [SAR324 cluster bacterium]|nr:hypothetical protein [SAR324 cluster bacterium]